MDAKLDILAMEEGGYRPLVDFESWRVASLTYADAVAPGGLRQVERHLETDEVFFLAAGRAVLIVETGEVSGNPENSGRIVAGFRLIEMKRNLLYNVRKAVWHHIVLSEDAAVLIVENSSTDYDNSEYRELPRETLSRMIRSIPKL